MRVANGPILLFGLSCDVRVFRDLRKTDSSCIRAGEPLRARITFINGKPKHNAQTKRQLNERAMYECVWLWFVFACCVHGGVWKPAE